MENFYTEVKMNSLKIKELKKEYGKLQIKYGAKEQDSIYNGGCEENSDICFVFLNPTGRNIASDKSWKGRKSPWLDKKMYGNYFGKEMLLKVFELAKKDNMKYYINLLIF